jgi:hypothetical protein
MDTQQKTSEILLQEISLRLLAARQELDEFAVQLALGKAEAKDKFEELKKAFINRLNELNRAFSAEGEKDEVKKKIAALETQLNAGRAEEKKSFEAQVKKILAALVALESSLKKKVVATDHQTNFDHEVEMFKLKMEIIRLKLGMKKFEVKEDFKSAMEEAKNKIESIIGKAAEKIKDGKAKYTGFRDEIQSAYQHFRKALDSFSN